MAIDPTQVRRYAHGSRVPGWDDAADLTKDPAVVPDPATTPVPEHVRTAIEVADGQVPGHAARPRSRRCTSSSASTAGARRRRSSRRPASCALTPAYLTAVATFYDMFSTTPKGRHDVYVCTNISCSMLGADAILEAMLSAAGADPTST